MEKKKKQKTKKTISLWDFYWQVTLAAQKLTIIRKSLGVEEDDDAFDWIMESFDGEKIKANENGEFEMSTGGVMIRGWKDPDTKKQKVDFYFDLAAN